MMHVCGVSIGVPTWSISTEGAAYLFPLLVRFALFSGCDSALLLGVGAAPIIGLYWSVFGKRVNGLEW